jgi:MFS transporter, FHS family, glucose/mannose:H+ symporter
VWCEVKPKIRAPGIPQVFLYSGALLCGMGMTLLGPVLPLLAENWHLSDRSAGFLISAQFAGIVLGCLSIQRNPRRGMLLGASSAACGLLSLAALLWLAGPVWPAFLMLPVAGFGMGLWMAEINVFSGKNSGATNATPAALLNFHWGVGALTVPILARHFASRFGTDIFFLIIGVLMLCAFLTLLRESLTHSSTPVASVPEKDVSLSGISPSILGTFLALAFLYGLVESGVHGWLTTFVYRYAHHSLVRGQNAATVFWGSLTLGRLVAAAVFLRWSERRILCLAAAGGLVCLVALLWASTWQIGWQAGCIASLLGLFLAPIFPALIYLLTAEHPTPRQAGVTLSCLSVGATLSPSLIGAISSGTESLRAGLAVPLVATALLLLLTSRLNRSRQPTSSTEPSGYRSRSSLLHSAQ